jgi:ubiquitin-like protein Pup
MQEQVRRREAKDEAEEAEVRVRHEANELTEGLDALLDEIDDVLEENAEAFVRDYIQKGGE